MSRRSLIACVMGAWGVFLLWFAWTETMARFLGPRTYWVAWFGAFGLLLAGVAGLRGAGRGAVATIKDIGGAALMVIPLVLVLLLPAPQLGAQAASRKAAGVGALSSFIPQPSAGDDVGLKEIHYASLSADYADTLGITDGVAVELTGFVTHPSWAADGEFGLTRFYISCCAADAVPFTVVVRPDDPASFSDDTWLTVEGELVRSGTRFVLEAKRIERAEEPSAPYLY